MVTYFCICLSSLHRSPATCRDLEGLEALQTLPDGVFDALEDLQEL